MSDEEYYMINRAAKPIEGVEAVVLGVVCAIVFLAPFAMEWALSSVPTTICYFAVIVGATYALHRVCFN